MIEELFREREYGARAVLVVQDLDGGHVVFGRADREKEPARIERDLLGHARGEDAGDEFERNHDRVPLVADVQPEENGRLVHDDHARVYREHIAVVADAQDELAVARVPELGRLEDAGEIVRGDEELVRVLLEARERHVLRIAAVGVNDAEALRGGCGAGRPRSAEKRRKRGEREKREYRRPDGHLLRSRSLISRLRSRSASRSAITRRLSISRLPLASPSSTFTLPASLK